MLKARVEHPACASLKQLVLGALDTLTDEQVEDYLRVTKEQIAKAAK